MRLDDAAITRHRHHEHVRAFGQEPSGVGVWWGTVQGVRNVPGASLVALHLAHLAEELAQGFVPGCPHVIEVMGPVHHPRHSLWLGGEVEVPARYRRNDVFVFGAVEPQPRDGVEGGDAPLGVQVELGEPGTAPRRSSHGDDRRQSLATQPLGRCPARGSPEREADEDDPQAVAVLLPDVQCARHDIVHRGGQGIDALQPLSRPFLATRALAPRHLDAHRAGSSATAGEKLLLGVDGVILGEAVLVVLHPFEATLRGIPGVHILPRGQFHAQPRVEGAVRRSTAPALKRETPERLRDARPASPRGSRRANHRARNLIAHGPDGSVLHRGNVPSLGMDDDVDAERVSVHVER